MSDGALTAGGEAPKLASRASVRVPMLAMKLMTGRTHMRRSNRQGDKPSHKIKVKPKPDNEAFNVDHDEHKIDKTRQAVASNKKRLRQADKLSYNWEAFGGDQGKLMSSPLIKTKVIIARKTYKRWGKK